MAAACQRGRSSATLSVITAVAVIVVIDLVFPVPTIATARRGGNEAKRDHCNKTVDIYEDVSTPAPTPDIVGKPLTCWYRFRSFRGTPRDWILRIRFKKFKVGTLLNATHCQGGFMQIVDGNAKTDVSNRRDIGLFCGESEQPQTFISETSFVRVLFHTDNFTDQTYLSFDSRAEQQLEVYLRYGQHPELYPNRRGEVVAGGYCERVFRDCRLQTCYVQSPAYPGVYPRGLHCRYHLNTRLPFIKLYIENEEFNVDGQRCENIMTCPMRPIVSGPHHCPYDFLRVFDGRDEGAPLIGTFCGTGKFPYSIIGTSEDLFVEFVSSPAGPLLNTGFHFNVGNWPGHVDTAGSRNGTCDWVLTAEALEASGDAYGIFLSVAHWYPAHTSCTYLMRGRPGEIVRLYFPSFRVNRVEAAIEPWEGDCAESLTLYDADRPDDARIIKTFCDTFSRPLEKHDFVSSGSSLFVRFESKTGSYSGSSLYYWAHYDFFNNTASGERVTGSACDELFASWRLQEGRLRSPMNTLVYKQPQGVRCMYRFVTDRRLFARVILTVESITLKEHPYQTASCQSCWVDRVDKVIIYEPSATASGHNTTTPLTCMCKQPPTSLPQIPLTLVSASDRLTLELQVEAAHAAAAYFKHVEPLFEARYSFVHPPLCGPPVLEPATDGELRFPHYEALGYLDPPASVHCIWELKVNRERDLWLHFDKVRFATRPCADGILEVRLGGFGADWTSHAGVSYAKACGENVSALKEVPIISSAELAAAVPSWSTPEHLSVRIEFIGTVTPARASFRIAWTELFHLPRNPDGTLATARRTQDCEFACPGDAGLCIPRSLVCNGHVNCPNTTSSSTGTLSSAESGIPGVIAAVSDESPELCARTDSPLGANWLAIGLGAAGGVVLALSCVIILCRLCCHKRHADDQLSVPY